VRSRRQKDLSRPPFARISFGNLDAGRFLLSIHECSRSRQAIRRHPESRRQSETSQANGTLSSKERSSGPSRTGVVCAAEDDKCEWLRKRVRDNDYFFSQSLFSRASRAASTSAACLLRPVPRPRTSASQRASTTKVLACSGPVAESTS